MPAFQGRLFFACRFPPGFEIAGTKAGIGQASRLPAPTESRGWNDYAANGGEAAFDLRPVVRSIPLDSIEIHKTTNNKAAQRDS
jgi:hypothetical protein